MMGQVKTWPIIINNTCVTGEAGRELVTTRKNLRPTMTDVAKKAGVSQRTVSNVVRNYQYVAPHTRERVLKTIAEIGYRPNKAARQLRSGRTKLIALAVPDITWPYFSMLAQAIQVEANRVGLTLIVRETRGSASVERQVLEDFHTGSVDGLIISPIELSGQELRELDLGIPVVLLGERIHDAGLLHLSIDNVSAARKMMEYLIDRGARSFWIVGDSDTMATRSAGKLRKQGFIEAASLNGFCEDAWIQLPASPWTLENGYATVSAQLGKGRPPDAIICMNDLLALGALRACQESGFMVPQDTMISGWDDIPFAAFCTPPITTISADLATISRKAVGGLKILFDEPDSKLSDVTVGYKLLSRESTGTLFSRD